MYETQLSIVIVNYNVKYFLQQCLYSVRAATQGLETDIYVVDNHSTDQSVEYLRPLFPEVTFIENTENVGFAKANNQALRICKGEYVLILNPDTVIGEESLRSLYFFMEDHPEAGALGLKLCFTVSFTRRTTRSGCSLRCLHVNASRSPRQDRIIRRRLFHVWRGH